MNRSIIGILRAPASIFNHPYGGQLEVTGTTIGNIANKSTLRRMLEVPDLRKLLNMGIFIGIK